MSHARVEELPDSDSDPEIEDPSSISFPQSSSSIIAPVNLPQPGPSKSPAQISSQQAASTSMPSILRPTGPTTKPTPSKATLKPYSTLYPVYFDSSRTRTQGRRTSSALSTPNPLARDIAEACQYISSTLTQNRLQIGFEPDKVHPKDWSNPGRVRVLLRNPDTGIPVSSAVKNKSHLYILVARYLQQHPTTVESPLKLRIQGVEPPEKWVGPVVPRGWRINSIVPLHSAALSGGGVAENFFKDMMNDMQKAGGGGGMPQIPGGMAGLLGGAGARAETGGSRAGGSGDGGGKKKDKKKGK